MNSLTNEIYRNTEFISIIKDIIENDTVKQMKDFRQHYDTTCFDHCLEASYYCYLICKKFNLDYVSAARASMLHDLFLYDWRKRQNGRKGLHAFTHPKTALQNSLELFELNKKEQDIILKHMWPVTVIPPKYLESFILTLVDKYCAVTESIRHYSNWLAKKPLYRYAYVSLCLLFIRL